MSAHRLRSLRHAGTGVALLFTLAVAGGHARGVPLPLEKVADVPLTGRTTRWDYASLDLARHLLFLAHLGDSKVTVVDTRKRRVVADLDVSRVHGVLAIPALDRVYATATGVDEVVAIDAARLKVVARAPTGRYPDGLAYAPRVHKLYVSNEVGGSDTVIDVRENRRIATIALGGEAGNTQYDPVSGHVFVNVQTRAQLAEIDPATDRVVARIDLPGARGNHGLYIDAPARLAYIACEDNARLLVLDLRQRRVTASYEVGDRPDVLAFDPGPGWLYVASESGEVALFARAGRALRPIGRGMLGPDAHVVAVDPVSHRAYFPLKAWKGRPVLRVMQPRAAAPSP